MVREAGIVNAVFHWYSGSLDILDNIIEDGYFISATSALAYSPHHQTAIESASLERILIETDYPVEYQGKVSETDDLVITLRESSHIKGLETDKVKCITPANAERFISI